MTPYPSAADLLGMLMHKAPRPTEDAPTDCGGIYGLCDHHGDLRCIDATGPGRDSFHARIHQGHRTGANAASHPFSRIYNSGRMWRDDTDTGSATDARVAHELRLAFVAAHCRAVWIPLPGGTDLAALSARMIALAPPPVTAWNRPETPPCPEPEPEVDALIETLDLSPFQRAALGRQRARFAALCAPRGDGGALPALPQGPFRFFALDVETANHDRASICQVGVACVRADDRIETWVTLVDPRVTRWAFSGLHGIDAKTVAGAPSIKEVLACLDEFLDGHTVYQHSGFDRSAIRAACAGLGRPEPAWDWKDSVGVARRAWPGLKGNGGHGLASLKRHLGLRFHHHDAGEDARAAAQIVLRAEAIG